MKFLATLLSLLVISQQSLGCFVWVLTPAPSPPASPSPPSPSPPAPSPLVDPQYRSMLQLRVEDGKYYKNPNWRVGPNKRVGLMIYSKKMIWLKLMPFYLIIMDLRIPMRRYRKGVFSKILISVAPRQLSRALRVIFTISYLPFEKLNSATQRIE